MPDHSNQTTTILLLVSDPITRAVLAEKLEEAGYMVHSTADLGQAVDRLKHTSPDLLITRTYVQGLPGHDAATYLRTKCPKMRVMMVGGVLDDDRLRHRSELQKFHVFPKPYSSAEFLQEVKTVLSTPRS